MWTHEEFIADRHGGETSTGDSAAIEQDCGTPGERQPALSEETAEPRGLAQADVGSVTG